MRRGLSISRCRIGSRNAAVLPLPVCAQASTSRPGECRRDRLGLDRRRAREPELADPLEQGLMKAQLRERHPDTMAHTELTLSGPAARRRVRRGNRPAARDFARARKAGH